MMMKNLSTDKRSLSASLLARLKQTCKDYALTMHSLRKPAVTALLCLVGFSAQAQSWKGTDISTIASSSDTDVNTVYLYNVGKKQWLCRGGRWGTEAVLSDVGLPLTVSKTTSGKVMLKTGFKPEGTATTAYVTFSGTSTSTGIIHDELNFFMDQQLTGYDSYTFTAVTTTDGTVQYQITNSAVGSTYYMVGAYNKQSTSLATNTDQINAFLKDSLPADNSDKWIVVTRKERKDYFASCEASNAAPAPATFLLTDHNYNRRDENITSWKYQKGSDSSDLYYGVNGNGESTLGDPTKAQADGYNYYVGCGYNDADYKVDPFTGDTVSTSDAINLQQYYGGKWTANLHGPEGVIYQEVSDLFRAGWYNVKARVFTTATQGDVKLFVSAGGATERKEDLTDYDENDVPRISTAERPTTYLDAWKLVNATKTVGGKTVYAYDVNVSVYVSENSGSYDKLAFGIRVSDADNAAWTCIDQFLLTYLGESQNNYVVLDENRSGKEYINLQIDSVLAKKKKTTVYLHRELKAGQWNSIMLPFSLSGDAISAVFGTGTKVAKFEGASNKEHPYRMYFAITDTIGARHPYIIKPTKDPQALNAEVVSSASDTITLAQGTSCYTLAGVSFDKKVGNEIIYGEGGFEDRVDSGHVLILGNWGKVKYTPNEGMYAISAKDGLWYYRTSPVIIKGFHAWIEVHNQPAQAPEFVIDDETYDVTKIDDVTVNNVVRITSQNIYNLNGQLVSTGGTIEGLPKGIYIVGGKKIVVR